MFNSTLMGTEPFDHGRDRPAPLDRIVTDGAEALYLADIDWTVTTRPLGEVAPELAGKKNASRHQVSVRSNDGAVIGVNGNRHTTIQNAALAELGDQIVRFRPDFKYVSGGASVTGETTFLILESDELVTFKDNDKGCRSILLVNDHNGNLPLFGVASTLRFFCMNQFTVARKQGKRLFTVRHTASADWAIVAAKQALVEQVKQYDAVDEELQRLLNTEITLSEVRTQIIGQRPDVTPANQRAITMYDSAWDRLVAEYTADWNMDHMGTAFGVVMAAQGADEHSSRCRNGQRDAQRVNRLIRSNYPLMERALTAVG